MSSEPPHPLTPVALARYLSEQLRAAPRPTLVCTRSSQEAYQLEQAFQLFAPDFPYLRHFPDWETLPYDHFSPQPDIVSERLATLRDLRLLAEPLLLICPLSTVLQRLAPVSFLGQSALHLRAGMHLPMEQFVRNLMDSGYEHEEAVEVAGSMARRGGIVDFFPMGSELPLRLEWFDEEIESIRYFDPQSQRSMRKIEEFSILPAQEFPFDAAARRVFAEHWSQQFPQAYTRSPLLLAVKDGVNPNGIEYYLPLFCAHTESLFDYLPDNSALLLPADYRELLAANLEQIQARYTQNLGNFERPPLEPHKLYLGDADLQALLELFDYRTYQAGSAQIELDTPARAPVASEHPEQEQRLAELIAANSDSGATRLLLCVEGVHKLELIEHQLDKLGHSYRRCADLAGFLSSSERLGTCGQALAAGCIWPQLGWGVLGTAELFNFNPKTPERRQQRGATSAGGGSGVQQVGELSAGAVVVHERYGVGRYLGLEYFEENGIPCEYLHLEYAQGAELFVPVGQIGLIAPLVGVDPENISLDSLGSNRWAKARAKAREQIHDHAADLLKIQALRQQHSGNQYQPPAAEYHDFCAAFPYPLTPDQLSAIEAVEQDLQSPQPMDRLICGDVGFGKTEVAIRAAYLVCSNGHQVAVLTPTTLLAQQHLEVFQERFAGTAINIAGLSRLSANNKQTIAALASGGCDLVIGTHKLLQKDVRFSKLALVIIDEEHRFGVQAKEKLKQLRAQIDILTLTATPIPRTLNFAFAGIKELSIISTPPVNRHAIKTFVSEYSDALVSEAINRELLRAGQVYYLYNRVDSIEQKAQELARLLPNARIGVAHGQLRESQLEHTMRSFYQRQYDILLTTTIVESGIDVPNANTIVIERADKLGLAQLHQLRGRVGRSDRQAYAFLLKPQGVKLARDAEKRLQAISSAHDLGAGFTLATQDMEIRGAGELLGAKQSGVMERIGFSLYQRLLKQAVRSLESGELSPELESAPIEIELGIAATLPADYIPDVHLRMTIYQRLSQADAEGLEQMRLELYDRFGKLPPAAEQLVRQHQLRLSCARLGLSKITGSASALVLNFNEATKVKPETLISLLQSHPLKYQLLDARSLKLKMDLQEPQTRLQQCEELLVSLAG